MTEQDLLKYSKPVLAKYIARMGEFVFHPDALKGDLDQYRREFELAAINKDLDLNGEQRKGLIGKGDPKSKIRYYELMLRWDRLMSRLMKL